MHIPSSAPRHAPASPLRAGVISAGGWAMLVFSSRRALPRALARARWTRPGGHAGFDPRPGDSTPAAHVCRRDGRRYASRAGRAPGRPGRQTVGAHTTGRILWNSQAKLTVPSPPSASYRRLEGNHSRHGDRGVRRGLNPDRPANPAGPITGRGPPRPCAPLVALVSVRRQAHSAKPTGVLGPTRAQPHRRGRRRAARR